MTVEDKRNDPSRRPNPLAVSWEAGFGGSSIGTTKHYRDGGYEDERGMAEVRPANAGRYSFYAEHYDPYNRDPSDEDAGWQRKQGDFVVHTQHRAMIAGESLLRRMQMAPGGTYGGS